MFVPAAVRAGPGAGRRCSLDGKTAYLGYPDSEVAATLDRGLRGPQRNRPAWVVTLTFDGAAGPRQIGATAVARAGMLVLVDDQDRVLLTHRPVTVRSARSSTGGSPETRPTGDRLGNGRGAGGPVLYVAQPTVTRPTPA